MAPEHHGGVSRETAVSVRDDYVSAAVRRFLQIKRVCKMQPCKSGGPDR